MEIPTLKYISYKHSPREMAKPEAKVVWILEPPKPKCQYNNAKGVFKLSLINV